MKKSKIYTKTGDEGTTGLVSGHRISKADERICLYGELDELNSRIGVSASILDQISTFKRSSEFLHQIQSAIFDLSSNLACEIELRDQYKLPQISSDFISSIEEEIDAMDSTLEPLKHFILPGGSPGAASVHLCRTSTRNCERLLIHFHETKREELPENALTFLNRLSDYFFVLARYINHELSIPERIWIPRR